MSCCGQSDPAAKQSKEVDKQLRAGAKIYHSTIKLLLLGAGESGKSTFFKQLKIINLNGFSEPEREGYKHLVYSNIISNIIALLEAATKFQIPLKEENEERAKKIFGVDSMDLNEQLFIDISQDIKELWQDSGLQKCFNRSSEFQLNDSAEYFFNEIDRVATKDYIPSVDDILRIRVKTSGITELAFEIGNDKFLIVDVGGQRSERRKWIYCFEGVTAIIFCAALSEYDQKLSEEESVNRMSEALKLFHDIVNYKCFVKTSIILFLNKVDIFQKKIKRVPLTVLFKDYAGSNDWEEASDFIRGKFLELAPGKQIYVHKTTATDTRNMTIVFRAVKDIIVTHYLQSMGLLSGMGMMDASTMASPTVNKSAGGSISRKNTLPLNEKTFKQSTQNGSIKQKQSKIKETKNENDKM